MTEGSGGEGRAKAGKPRTNLQLRVISAIVLILVVFAVTYLGGLAFKLLAIAIGAAVYLEWHVMMGARRMGAHAWIAAASLVAAFLVLAISQSPDIILLAIAAAVIVSGLSGLVLGHGFALAGGVAYAAFPAAALALLRGDDGAGIIAVLFLFLVVWATDIFAYFVGRRVGGPKLAPGISPNKTWSGAIGGAVAAALAGLIVSAFSGAPGMAAAVALALFLSIVAQFGDLFESALKRRFGVKDSGTIIPGHGGMMDRVDGLVAAAVALYLVGIMLGGAGAASNVIFSSGV